MDVDKNKIKNKKKIFFNFYLIASSLPYYFLFLSYLGIFSNFVFFSLFVLFVSYGDV